MRRVLLAALLVLLVPLRSHATDQTVLGKQLLVKDPSTPDKRKVLLKVLDPAGELIVGDPTVAGATLTISVYGGTASAQIYSLPATLNAKGKPFWKGSYAKGFKYSDSKGENGPLKVAQLKVTPAGTFQIKAVISGKTGPVVVHPPNAGIGGCALLQIGGGGDSYSVRFKDGSIKNKDGTLFAVKDPTTQGSCSTCGNGFPDPGEQCDDGNTVNGDGCDNNCTSSGCGNGIVDPGELCDDGNNINGDMCDNNCTPPACGNAIVDPGEQCDPTGPPCPQGTCQADCTCPCDFLDPSDCLYPFPSDYLTIADPTTDSGRRVHFATSAMPQNSPSHTPITPTDYNLNDGFSEGVTILTHVPQVDLNMTGAPPITDIGSSQNANAPIVVVNAATLEHHLIWAELDANATSEPVRALIIHPAVNFAEGQRYIVALRQMKDSTGAIIPPSATFQAYRDGMPTGDPVKEARRAHMEDLFTTLVSAGVGRSDLYLAWDFTVESERNNTERMLFVRDDGFARLGLAAPSFTVTDVQEDVSPTIFRQVTGTFNVERYVNSTTPPALFVLDSNGLPIHQATPQVASFICIIPYAALADDMATAVPARASIYGHGLLGSNTEVTAGNVEDMANEHNFVFCATKWLGMSDEDVGYAVQILQNLSKFPALTDRLQQGMLDQLYLARLMIHPQGFVSVPAFQDAMGHPVIDTSAVFYDGNSQGGIFGGTVMALSTDILRGVLGVTGMDYSLLLTRSTDFAGYSAFLYPAYPNQLQRPLVLALIQMLWDRSDPNGYAQHIIADPLPNTPAHKVLMHEAFGDHQVANISCETEARTIGVSVHQPAINSGRIPDVVPFYGIPAIPSDPFDGSALVMWDSGADPPPLTNTAPMTSYDPHGDPRKSSVARTQKSDFLQAVGGTVVDVCSGVPCVIPHVP